LKGEGTASTKKKLGCQAGDKSGRKNKTPALDAPWKLNHLCDSKKGTCESREVRVGKTGIGKKGAGTKCSGEKTYASAKVKAGKRQPDF